MSMDGWEGGRMNDEDGTVQYVAMFGVEDICVMY